MNPSLLILYSWSGAGVSDQSSSCFSHCSISSLSPFSFTTLPSYGLDLEVPRSVLNHKRRSLVESLHIPSALSLSPRRASTQVEHLYNAPPLVSSKSSKHGNTSPSKRSPTGLMPTVSSTRRGSSASFAGAPYYPNSITLTGAEVQARRASMQAESLFATATSSMSASPTRPVTFNPFTMDSFSESLR